MFMSLIYFEFILFMVWDLSPILFFYISTSNFPSTICRTNRSSPTVCSFHPCRRSVDVDAGIHFWALYSSLRHRASPPSCFFISPGILSDFMILGHMFIFQPIPVSKAIQGFVWPGWILNAGSHRSPSELCCLSLGGEDICPKKIWDAEPKKRGC